MNERHAKHAPSAALALLAEHLRDARPEVRAAFAALAADVAGKARAAPSGEMLQAVLESSSATLYYLDYAGDRYEYMSPAVETLTGLTTAHFLATPFSELLQRFHPDDFAKVKAKAHSLAPRNGGTVSATFEYRFRHASGEWRWFSDWSTMTFDASGRLLTSIGSVYDISAQRDVIQALRESEQRYRLLAANSDDVICIFNPSLRLTYASPSVTRALGWTPEEMTRMSFEDYMTPQALTIATEGFARRMAMERAGTPMHEAQRNEMLFRCKDGREIWLECVTSPLRDEQNVLSGVLVVARNISERKKAEEALRHEEHKFRALIENQKDVVVKFSASGELRYVSPSFCRLFQLPEELLLGRNILDFVHPDDRSTFADVIERLHTPPHVAVYEKRMLTRAGWRWIACTDTPVMDRDGRVVEVIAVGRDVTEQRALEKDLRAAKDEAEAASRAKSEFLANMSHEIRNPLNAVLGLADLLLMGSLVPEQRERATLLKNAAASLLGVISDILDYSKIEAGGVELERYPFDPGALARSLVEEQRVLAAEKGIRLDLRVFSRLPRRVVGDETKVRQILLNLLSNAIKFTDEGGVEVIVRTAERHDGGPTLLFAVTDSGIGVPPGMQDKIFESFRQAECGLRKRHGGTGLGLAICRRMVELMGGKIWFQSDPGNGSVFCFTVPVAAMPGTLRKAAGPERPAAPNRALTLLLVEDDWTNRRFTSQLLERHGHRVLAAENGEDALNIIGNHDVDAVIMDMQMPVMDGLAATLAIRAGLSLDGRRLPCDIPVIGLTAYATEEDRRRFLAAGADACLTKPLRIDRLLATLHDMLVPDQPSDEALPGPLLDEAQIGDHIEAGVESFAHLLERFVEDTDLRLERVAADLESGDLRDAAMTAHSLAGAAGMMGGLALREKALALEAEIKADNAVCPTAIEDMRSLVGETVAAIRDRLTAVSRSAAS